MSNLWKDKWIEDIDYLKKNLIDNHANLFFNTTIKDFEEKCLALKDIVDELDYDEMKVEISKIVASVGDAHTAVAFPINNYLPFKFYYFKDGIYIIKVIEGYEDLLYKKVDSIENTEIELVLREVEQIISHENEFLLKAQVVKYLQAVDVLFGLYICDEKEKVRITVEGNEIVVPSVQSKDLIYTEVGDLPIYAQLPNQNYWYRKAENELYIKYNSCREDGVKGLEAKIRETIDFIEKNNIDKITIDLRNNLGGDSTLLQPLINYIKENKVINQRENLKVAIGRETFSSALLNAYQFKLETNATIVGEPSGGKPNCYGEILRFTLPNSKFNVSYSTRYYKLIEDDNILALYPDEIIEESIDDYVKLI